MSFTSVSFLFLFLPAALALFHATPPRHRAGVLVALSLVFYASATRSPLPLAIVLLSSALCHGSALLIAGAGGRLEPGGARTRRQRGLLLLAVALNLLLLGVFKYHDFGVRNLAGAAALLGRPFAAEGHLLGLALPLGISFFTFQAIAYVVDVYRGTAAAAGSFLHVLCAMTMFPKIALGPIPRHGQLGPQIAACRPPTAATAASGAARFTVGLAKKAIVANTAALVADDVFAMSPAAAGPGILWLGALAYTAQIYFDFSGYTDMAIGLGRLLGFELPENFEYPYLARSVREFWQRWHITLSNWFRDYLYIPLGGNRVGTGRGVLNLLVVFLLCGLWHGASWTFIAWGGYHGLLLSLERLGLGRLLLRSPRPLQHAYALLAVVVGWVLFRSGTFAGASAYLAGMFSLGAPTDWVLATKYVKGFMLAVAAAAVVGSTPAGAVLAARLRQRAEDAAARGAWAPLAVHHAVALAGLACVFVLSVALLAGGVSSPFLYAQF